MFTYKLSLCPKDQTGAQGRKKIKEEKRDKDRGNVM